MTQKQEVFSIEQATPWGQIESLAQHAVVQVSAQIGVFNWLEPYKIDKQYEGRGSGFFINGDGYCITNVHVIEQAKTVWVYLPALGREPLYADVVSICPESDIALLKLTAASLKEVRSRLNGIPHLVLGDSDALQRTQGVLSLGYPLGQYRLKSTTGVISGREIVDDHSLIEMTAAINPGSSGGPLLNAYGQVIGITVASVPSAQSVGYAIPINELVCVLDDLYKNKLVHKPFLGGVFVYGCDEKAAFFKNPQPAGVYVSIVFKGSLLDIAGVRAGDMVYEFNGLRLDPYGDAHGVWQDENMTLHDLLSHVKIGDTVSLLFYRNGQKKEVSFDFTYKSVFAIEEKYPLCEPIEYETIAGVVLMELTLNHIDLLLENAPELYAYQLSENRLMPRLVVTHVVPGSYAHQMSMIRPGDIVTLINGKKVHTVRDFRRRIPESISSGYVTINTQIGAFIVLSLSKVIADEERLAADFLYPMSKVVHRLKNALLKRDSKIV